MNKVKIKKKNKVVPVMCVVLGALLIVCIGIIFTKGDKKDKQPVEQSEEQSVEQNEDVVQEEVAFYEIETKFCKLFYPESWKKQIEIKYTENAGYKVEFYGLVDGKDAIHLFNVCFNSDDGDLLGYLETGEEVVNVSVEMMDVEFSDSWKQKEIEQIYAMQEEMNFVVDSLSKNENYVEP